MIICNLYNTDNTYCFYGNGKPCYHATPHEPEPSCNICTKGGRCIDEYTEIQKRIRENFRGYINKG
jgi:hypothetical protein